MFVGHYSVAFAVKSERNKIPLWVLFVAVQFLDYIWATFVLLGIEKLRVIKGFTAGSMLDSYYHPYSHSLIAAILWSSVAAIGYKPLCGWLAYSYRKSAALIVGVAVFSHWILDLVAHPHDLPIYDNKWKVGFGLWNYRGLEFGLEIALLAVGIILYLRRNAMSAARKRAAIGFGLALVVVQIGDTFVPRTPLSDKRPPWVFGFFIHCLSLSRSYWRRSEARGKLTRRDRDYFWCLGSGEDHDWQIARGRARLAIL